jgi:hypothetical protein
MKIVVQAAIAACSYLMLSSTALAEQPVTTFNANALSITADNDEANLLALPVNAPTELVKQHSDMEAKRAALLAERTRLLELMRKVDFDSARDTTDQLLTQLAACEEKLDALEDAETSFLQDKEVFLAGASHQASVASQPTGSQTLAGH